MSKFVDVAIQGPILWTFSAGEVGITRNEMMDRDTDEVMKERVATSTRSGYDRSNISFITWIFDCGVEYEHLLKGFVLAEMQNAHSRDKARLTKKGKPSKARDYLREVCRDSLVGMKPDSPDTTPILLGNLNFTIYSRYLSTFQKKCEAFHNKS